jgi:hypothetical protein
MLIVFTTSCETGPDIHLTPAHLVTTHTVIRGRRHARSPNNFRHTDDDDVELTGAGVDGLVLIACLVYVGRRCWPFSMFVLSVAATLVYIALGYVAKSIVVRPMIGIYSLATRIPARQAIAAAVVIMVALTAFSSEFGAFGSLGGPTNVIPRRLTTPRTPQCCHHSSGSRVSGAT